MEIELPRTPLSHGDASAVIGLLAVLEGELLVGGVEPALAHQIRDRFVGADLLPDDAELAHLRRALGDLNQRVRYAHGEYAEPPEPEGPIRHDARFDTQQSATGFREEAASLWSGATTVARPDDQIAWVVTVADHALPLTDEFTCHQSALEQLARRFNGRYDGWGA